jgi:hypothetical protein
MAEALRDGKAASTSGRIAGLALMALSGRGAELVGAAQKIKIEPAITEAQKSWISALHKFNTLDWRETVDPKKSPFLEQYAQARALGIAVGDHRLMDYLENIQFGGDWARLVLDIGLSVGSGHAVAPVALNIELKDLSEVWSAHQGAPMPDRKFAEVLNPLPGRCVQSDGSGKAAVKVMDWGTWAAHFQRHICHEILAIQTYLRDLWGVPEKAEAFWKSITPLFSDLRFFPVVERMLMKKPTMVEYRPVMDRIMPTVRKHPELITVFEWKVLLEKPMFAKVPDEMPGYSPWFSMRVLPGTCYHSGGMLFHPKHLFEPDKDDMAILKNRNPYNYWVSEKFAWIKFRASRAAGNYAEAFGPLRDYHITVMTDEAESNFVDPDKYREAYLRVCELDPDRYLNLGAYLVKNDRPEQAAEAYQKAVDLAPSRIGVANKIDWLVNYYYDHTNTVKAVEIADMAADVYSYRGLETKAKLMEKMKNYEEAERLYLAIDERYDDKKIVFRFYQRALGATQDPKYQTKLDAMKQ